MNRQKGVSESLSGFGYNFLVGAEYYLSDHIGIGANLGYIGSSLPKQDNIDYKDGEHSGNISFAFGCWNTFSFLIDYEKQ